MKNVLFISPHYPLNYWQFCRELRRDGLNVLGIGDQPWDGLDSRLKESLTEYYYVPSLEDYDQVYRAAAFLIFKHGRIDFLESNNEYWLELDARLRTDFNIPGGFRVEDLPRIKYKSGMKEYYRRAGIPAARFHMVDDREGCLAFLEEVGWPVIVKPDNGVGASGTWRLDNEEQLASFLDRRDAHVPYIMEEFIDGQICSYDAILDSRGEPLFETGNITGIPIMDIVNNHDSAVYHILKELPEDTRAFGRAAAKSFGVTSRFVHFEFFRLNRDQHIGKKGTLAALEVNMRPSGGYTPDMINFAHSTDVYKIWADMVAFDRSEVPAGPHRYCAFVGRRDSIRYRYGSEELTARYAGAMRLVERLPGALAGAMGDQVFMAVFDTQEELDAFDRDAVSVL